MGNILEEDFMDIWNGENYQTLRADFYEGRLRDCCKTCSLIKQNENKRTS